MTRYLVILAMLMTGTAGWAEDGMMTLPERFFATLDQYIPWILMIALSVAGVVLAVMLICLVGVAWEVLREVWEKVRGR